MNETRRVRGFHTRQTTQRSRRPPLPLPFSPFRFFFVHCNLSSSLFSPSIIACHFGIAAISATSPHQPLYFLVIARFSIMATSPPLSSPSLSSNAHAHFSSQYTNGHLPAKLRVAEISSISRLDKTYPASIASTPEVHINGRPKQPRPSTSSASTHTHEDTAWGSHFWVTLIDPQASSTPHSFLILIRAHHTAIQTQVSFFACPSTGQVSWDPPVGNFVYVLMQMFPGHLPHDNNIRADYRPARTVNGGRLATNLAVVFRTITTQRPARPYGRSLTVLSYH